jgi:ATP-binding cassette, subfamily B, multidrug efflux pump
MIQRASASQKRINEFLQTKPQIHSPVNTMEPVLKGHIQFNQVSFTYPNTGILALDNFSMNIQPGGRIAIIGKTGSGKSTVAQLLLRLFDASKGSVTIDDIPLPEMNLQGLRKQISYVPQDVFLFSDTVENNIKFGNDTASHDTVVRTAQMASVDAEIRRFEHGYETVIGERGVTLSGGQKQRLSITRALIKQSPIIVFDDCLSAVDARTEKEILSSLDEELAGKTAIIITHRIFSLLQFDNIIVMDEGRIVEQGMHEQLLAKNGAYTELYNLQQEQEQEQEVA